MRTLEYEKWNGTGNDFVIFVVSNQAELWVAHPDNVRRICDRNQGIGADGVVVLHAYSTVGAPLQADIINSDGTAVEMCGNALRCISALSSSRGFGQQFTMGGRQISARVEDDGQITVCLGRLVCVGNRPLFSAVPEFDQQLGYSGHLLSFGNPHYVIPVPRIPRNWEQLGRELQSLADRVLSTGGINLGWLSVEPGTQGEHRLCVYERGAGATASCGSGACAAAATLGHTQRTDSPYKLRLPGGRLTIKQSDDLYFLTGEATFESRGQWKED